MKMSDRLAYEVFVEDTRCFTFATSVRQARWNAISSAREAGYFLNRWPTPMVAKRAPQFDNSPLRERGVRTCYGPDYMY
jgi:hypothetical protein